MTRTITEIQPPSTIPTRSRSTTSIRPTQPQPQQPAVILHPSRMRPNSAHHNIYPQFPRRKSLEAINLPSSVDSKNNFNTNEEPKLVIYNRQEEVVSPRNNPSDSLDPNNYQDIVKTGLPGGVQVEEEREVSSKLRDIEKKIKEGTEITDDEEEFLSFLLTDLVREEDKTKAQELLGKLNEEKYKVEGDLYNEILTRLKLYHLSRDTGNDDQLLYGNLLDAVRILFERQNINGINYFEKLLNDNDTNKLENFAFVVNKYNSISIKEERNAEELLLIYQELSEYIENIPDLVYASRSNLNRKLVEALFGNPGELEDFLELLYKIENVAIMIKDSTGRSLLNKDQAKDLVTKVINSPTIMEPKDKIILNQTQKYLSRLQSKQKAIPSLNELNINDGLRSIDLGDLLDIIDNISDEDIKNTKNNKNLFIIRKRLAVLLSGTSVVEIFDNNKNHWDSIKTLSNKLRGKIWYDQLQNVKVQEDVEHLNIGFEAKNSKITLRRLLEQKIKQYNKENLKKRVEASIRAGMIARGDKARNDHQNGGALWYNIDNRRRGIYVAHSGFKQNTSNDKYKVNPQLVNHDPKTAKIIWINGYKVWRTPHGIPVSYVQNSGNDQDRIRNTDTEIMTLEHFLVDNGITITPEKQDITTNKIKKNGKTITTTTNAGIPNQIQDITGEIHIYSYLSWCPSCEYAIEYLSKALPNVTFYYFYIFDNKNKKKLEKIGIVTLRNGEKL